MDVARALKELSEPHSREEKITTIIERSARIAGLSYSRSFEIWYGRARRIEHVEVVRIEEALKDKRAREARNELSQLRLRLERLESLLVLSDEEFHRENIDPLRAALRRAR
jgi:hypothetical protein